MPPIPVKNTYAPYGFTNTLQGTVPTLPVHNPPTLPKQKVKPKKVNPRTYGFAWGQAAPGGTFDPTTIPGMPKFLQDPNMPPQPTLAPPDAPDEGGGGGPSWGGGGGGGGWGGGGSRRQSWISSLYSLNVNR